MLEVARRTYNQYCATARTLDVVGERWTLLIIRELLTGPKRFRDLLDSLQGIGTSLLADRLRYLESEGLVERVLLPPPARTPAYGLTDAGRELGPPVLALARWGMRWALREPRAGEEFRPGWAVLGMQAIFDPAGAANAAGVYEFRVDDEVFHARIADGAIETAHGAAQQPDVTITTSGEIFKRVAAGRLGLADAIREGMATVEGDRRALRRLSAAFAWPKPRERALAARR
jgi:DNA-binding HxlR family transcriptional regulator/putative sterol carrier protein